MKRFYEPDSQTETTQEMNYFEILKAFLQRIVWETVYSSVWMLKSEYL